jgi:hypothetical protein
MERTVAAAEDVDEPGLRHKWPGYNADMMGQGEQEAEIVFIVEEAAEGGLVARAVGESIFTQADSLEQLRHAVREAVACHFGDGPQPRTIRLRVVREEVL